jgi:hypothetical protein
MNRKLLFVAPFVLAACGGGGTMNLDITSDESDNALGGGSVTASSGVDLSKIQSVKVQVDEVWAHVDNKDAKDDVKGEDISDSGDKWQLVSEEDRELDLMTVRNNATKPLGELEMPAGKITQIRLKLKGGTEAGDRLRIAGAVVETSGTACDLSVPKSAVSPGVKISGAFKAMQIENGGKYHAIINLKLTDTTKETDGTTCVYKLNPVLKVKKYEVKSEDKK